MDIKNRLKYWRGLNRLWWGLCPECNSDAPELYDCKVCDGYNYTSINYQFPIDNYTRRLWKLRFGMTFKLWKNIHIKK